MGFAAAKSRIYWLICSCTTGKYSVFWMTDSCPGSAFWQRCRGGGGVLRKREPVRGGKGGCAGASAGAKEISTA